MGSSRMFGPRAAEKSVIQRLLGLNWGMILIICMIASAGFAMLYSVAGGALDPWASRQMIRFVGAFIIMIGIAVIDIRYWITFAYPAWFAGLILLIAVEIVGDTGMGGQRWLDLGFMRLQPSELMKIAIVMALARYYHARTYAQSKHLRSLLIPIGMLIIPFLLVARQPDLGTSLMIVAGGVSVIFLAGAPRWLFVVSGVGVAAAIPVVWQFMRPYQKSRVLTFMNPEADPLGAGYQITQSKIALGSGGLSGKGFLGGTQSHLNFLPEMKTDFIFTALVEEFGLIGALVVLGLYGIVLMYGLFMAIGCRNQFGRLLASGLSLTLFLYVLINVAMVMGLMPVVGVPLPLISYGGSAMLTWMVAYGLILSVATHRHLTIAPKSSGLG